ncbi:ATP-binding cassette, subfamily B [Treponema bryantii]|uniref:ATP-binding cassette, subfamily B n=1 Tax=Treponema bryantii TaxID=163 RepID=A0A1I3L779_9SPIR|nr:ABC transporter ATP-binding protein [Treponema bryantii]SFI80652.1 ATP-binding cassette, subfamily B [Treponema bryantii]
MKNKMKTTTAGTTANSKPRSTVLKNQIFLWKLCFKTCPLYMIYHLYDAFRYQGVIFLEHVLGIRYVLRCAEFHEPFSKALFYIGMILLMNILQIIPDGFFIYGWQFKYKPRLYRALKEQMFQKASKIDLYCYDDPAYYNDFVLSVSESEAAIDRFLELLNMTVQAITVLFTTGIFYLMTDPIGIAFVFVSFIMRFVVSKKLNKVNYANRVAVNPHMRKRDYVSRVFYLKDFAKELRLHPNTGTQLEEEFAQADDAIIAEHKKVAGKRIWLQFLKDYGVGDFLIDGLYITYLVYKAAVLHTVNYSDAVILFNRTGSLRGSMSRFADLGPKAHENSMFIDKIRAFLAYEPRLKDDEGNAVPEGAGELSLSHVSFKYSETGRTVLDDISLTVKPGEHIAIVGYNGAGKTTLIKLLMRLYDPTSGSISYHGQNVSTLCPREYHKRIGVVFQDYQMFGANLAENVVMDDMTKEEIEAKAPEITKALNSAGFEHKLQHLPDRLFTQVTTEFDKKGVDFSGGESQKVAISRAFYKNADILIMDEPSSALDPIAEYELNKAMETAAKGKTVFYISHRLSTTRDADRIIMLERGRIIEEGTHSELLARNGKYAEMWNAQAGKYN